MEKVFRYVVKIYQLDWRYGFQSIIKTTTKVIIIQFLANIFQYLQELSLMSGIQFLELLFKNIQKNIGIAIKGNTSHVLVYLAKIIISQTSQMHHCRHLNSCRF